jgi:hypothetical protein
LKYHFNIIIVIILIVRLLYFVHVALRPESQKKILGKRRSRWEDNIKMFLKEIIKGLDWMHSDQKKG